MSDLWPVVVTDFHYRPATEGTSMTTYDVEVVGTSREVYRITADTADGARRAYEANIASGLLTPIVSETYGGDVESVTEVSE